MNVKFADFVGLTVLVVCASFYAVKVGFDPFGVVSRFKPGATSTPAGPMLLHGEMKTGQESQPGSLAPAEARQLRIQAREGSFDGTKKQLSILVEGRGYAGGPKEVTVYWFFPNGQMRTERLRSTRTRDAFRVAFPEGAPLRETDWLIVVTGGGKILRACASTPHHLQMAGSDLALRSLEQTAARASR